MGAEDETFETVVDPDDFSGPPEPEPEGAGEEEEEETPEPNPEAEQLRQELSRERERVERLESLLVQKETAKAQPGDDRSTEQKFIDLDSAGEGEWSDEAKALAGLMENGFQKLAQAMESRATSLETRTKEETLRAADTRAEVRRLKEANADIWDFVRPLATEMAEVDPGIGVQEAWDRAVKKLQPQIDAIRAAGETAENRKKRAASEKPGAPAGGRKVTPKEAFERAYEESGLAEHMGDR